MQLKISQSLRSSNSEVIKFQLHSTAILQNNSCIGIDARTPLLCGVVQNGGGPSTKIGQKTEKTGTDHVFGSFSADIALLDVSWSSLMARRPRLCVAGIPMHVISAGY